MAHSHVLQRVLKLIGPQSTIRLAREQNGTALKVPERENLHDLHSLVVRIGMANACALAYEFGGEKLELPAEVNALLQIRNDAIAREFKAGASICSMSEHYQIDRKMVQKILDAKGLYELRMERAGLPFDQHRLDLGGEQ